MTNLARAHVHPATPEHYTTSARKAPPCYLVDFSLALANRTGAYYACREIVRRLPHHFAGVRYWRQIAAREPLGVVRKLMCKAMYAELDHLAIAAHRPWPRPHDLPVLYMDPLYVLHGGLQPRDIVLCHDVGPVTHPALFGPGAHRNYLRAYDLIRKRQPTMVFVSAASRHAFCELYGDRYPAMEVIPLFVREAAARGGLRQPDGVRGRFLLTVGAFDQRKNHRRMLDAFQQSGLAARGFTYVLCGPAGNASAEIEAHCRDVAGVVKLGYLAEDELRWLYANAIGFVLPSLIEGFGLPALEAAQHGLVSIVSAGGAQEEAVGDGGILVDPLAVGSIADGMRRLATMPDDERARRACLTRAHADVLDSGTFIARWNDLLEAQSPVSSGSRSQAARRIRRDQARSA